MSIVHMHEISATEPVARGAIDPARDLVRLGVS